MKTFTALISILLFAAGTPHAAEPAAPASQPAASAPAPAAQARPAACPHCFQPLAAGYKVILSELEPWLAEMEAKAAEFNSDLSAIQKQIDAKEKALEEAKAGTDKKAAKPVIKTLSGERKQLLKDYSAASDAKADFYKQFGKEAEKRVARYDKTVREKLQQTMSAASSE